MNKWIETGADILCCQFSTHLINNRPRDAADEYYDSVYNNVPGYKRPEDFWEIPQWIARASGSMPVDVCIIRDIPSFLTELWSHNYEEIAFSVLDVTAPLVEKVLQGLELGQHVVLGGYVDKYRFLGDENRWGWHGVEWFDRIEDWIESSGYEPRSTSYRLFNGFPTIPRLTMSTGCNHHCAFCCVPSYDGRAKEADWSDIVRQVESFAPLDFELVYLNDKTFGQAPNHHRLVELGDWLKDMNPEFRGFIIQTTASQFLKLDDRWLRHSHILYVELGVETYNDPILKELHKPATEALIDRAYAKAQDLGIEVIPNIMVGLPQENSLTYARTLEWLRARKVSHVNAYTLAAYEGTELGDKLGTHETDENTTERSWMIDKGMHERFRDMVFEVTRRAA